jgi:hypothetical protein
MDSNLLYIMDFQLKIIDHKKLKGKDEDKNIIWNYK